MAYYIPKSTGSMKKTDDTARIIVKLICSHPGCQIKLQNLQLGLRRSGNAFPHNITTFLEDYSDNFLINDDTVMAFTTLEICPEHCKRNSSCTDEYCDKLHICKFFLLSHCKFYDTHIPCKFGHSLDSENNMRLLRKHLLDKLTPQEIQRLFQSGNSRSSTTMPLICRFYNHQRGCMKQNGCPHLHICQFYVEGSCKFGARCKRNHNLNDQIMKILVKFGINTQRKPKDIIQDLRISLPSYSQNQQALRKFSSVPLLAQQRDVSFSSPHRFKPSRRKLISEGPTSSSSPSESSSDEICMYNLRSSNGCWFGDSCVSFHKPRAYQWQHQGGDLADWMDFEDFINKKLESHFRDVTCSECVLSFEQDSDSDDSDYSDVNDSDDGEERKDKGEVTVDFHTMKAFGQGRQFSIRRLGTASAATLLPQIARSFHDQVTRWLWYWYDDVIEEWTEYEEMITLRQRSGIDSNALEKAYAANPNGHIEFQKGDNNFKLKFSEMVQKNKDTKEKKHVRRRPVPLY